MIQQLLKEARNYMIGAGYGKDKKFTAEQAIGIMAQFASAIIIRDKILSLTKRHEQIMKEKDIIVQVYTNASGFLWAMAKVSSGTDLGWSDHNGDCEMSGSFTSYENALEDAVDLIDKCDLERFQKETPNGKFHWGNYSHHLDKNYR